MVIKQAIHPFDCYKMAMSIMLHFTNRKYRYDPEKGNFSFSTFETNKNSLVYHKLANTYSKQELYELFISNYLDTPRKHIFAFQNKAARDIYKRWQTRVGDVENLFIKDLKRFIESNKFSNLEDIYNKLTDSNIIKLEPIDVESIEQVVLDNPLDKTSGYKVKFGIEPIIQLKEYSPEFVSILDEICFRKYGSFLEKHLDLVDDKSEYHLKVYKYKHFLDLDSILQYPKIKAIIDF